jgi:hypothetical protein
MRFQNGWRPSACGCVAVLLAAALASPLGAAPNLSTGRKVYALTVYADSTRPQLFYYAPPEIALAKDSDGKPDFHFLMTRYMGTATSADRGVERHKSLISFRVLLPRIDPSELARAAQTLGVPGRPAEIRPLPIRSLRTALVYATVGSAGPDTVALPGGRFETAPDSPGAESEGYWTERVCSVGLDSLSAQVFQKALENGQVILSVGYAFLADGSTDAASDPGELQGSPALVAELQRQLGSQAAPHDSAANLSRPLRVIASGAIEIGLDVKRWPDLLRRVDLNDRVPPGYAALDVYCYDFNNDLRPDLAEKRVEIDAESIGGRRVKLDTVFRGSEPDLYSAGMRFPVAVRLDRPYRFRVSETKLDGTASVGRWQEVSSWNKILDVTSNKSLDAAPPPPKLGVRSVLGQ